MAKRRVATKRRQAPKTASFQRTAPRKRSDQRADLYHGHGQEVLQPGVFQATTEEVFVPTGHTSPKNLWALSAQMVNQLAEGATKQYGVLFGISMPPLAKQQAEFLSRLPTNWTLSPNGVQAITRELVNHLEQQVHLNFQAMNALTSSHSPLDLFKAQNDLAKGTFESIVQASSQISQIAIEMATRSRLGGGRTESA